MKGKSNFTRAEANAIIALINLKVVADKNTQKGLRNKIRAIGFYASDFGIGGGYTVQDFLSVVTIDNKSGNTASVSNISNESKAFTKNQEGKRTNSDESYIIDLCDEVLGIEGQRQHRFDFLKGDSGTKLPVDSYYAKLNLVIEYCERQHTEDVKFFNRRQTVSGVNRGEQRKLYDQRRRDELPKQGITLIEFDYSEFEHDKSKRLIRNKANDLEIIKKKLKDK